MQTNLRIAVLLFLRRVPGALLAGLLYTILSASPLPAQTAEEDPQERRLVEKLTLRGISSVDQSELRESLATKASSCRSLLVQPFCWVSDSDLWVEKHYLEPGQIARDELRIRVFYWLRGYRDAQVASTVEPEGDGVAVTFRIDERAPTRVNAVQVLQTDSVLSERAILQAGVPEVGEPLNLIALDSAQVRVLRMLWQRGYADAVVRDSAWLTEAGGGAAVRLTVVPGSLTTVGEIVIRGNEKVAESTIRSALPIDPGEVFRQSEIRRSQRALYRTGLFREALVSVPPQEDSAKLVEVFVREAPLRGVRAGLGFNTLEFVQAEAGFTRWNWPVGGGRLDLRATVGNLLAPQLNGTSIFQDVTPEAFAGAPADAFLDPVWQVSAELQQPIFRAAENMLGFGIFARRRIVPRVALDRGYGANASYTRRFAERTTASALYHFEITQVEAADVYYCVNFGVCEPPIISVLREGQRLSPLSADLVINRADNPLDPRHGYTIELDAEHASTFTLSDFRYNRVAAEGARYMELGSGVLAGRLRAGWVRALESTAEAVGIEAPARGLLHPRTRFYAGGARSVRGYRPNQLGPRILTIGRERLLTPADTTCTLASIRDGSCDPNIVPSADFDARPLGGNSIVEGSIEYRFPVWGNIGGAVFVDAATLGARDFLRLASDAAAVTPGLGVRYRSRIGAIRVDLGIRPSLVERLPVVTEVPDENGGTQIVTLPIRKRYDPLEGADGFLSQVLQRLTLHLAVGQAF
ncbi:MAG TPA: BamA/TamA family outer membrane protein [Longimicrobiaceae bacterium]|nr:BamA/TamA family outer membrane protein [Longimicrobiaceae bacterium]